MVVLGPGFGFWPVIRVYELVSALSWAFCGPCTRGEAHCFVWTDLRRVKKVRFGIICCLFTSSRPLDETTERVVDAGLKD